MDTDGSTCWRTSTPLPQQESCGCSRSVRSRSEDRKVAFPKSRSAQHLDVSGGNLRKMHEV